MWYLFQAMIFGSVLYFYHFVCACLPPVGTRDYNRGVYAIIVIAVAASWLATCIATQMLLLISRGQAARKSRRNP
jgi:hypothetical protein